MWGPAPQGERGDDIVPRPQELAMTSNLTRTLRCAATVLVAAAVVASTPTSASARETRDASPTVVTAYSEPQPALDGRSLAEYLADHVSRVLGPFDV